MFSEKCPARGAAYWMPACVTEIGIPAALISLLRDVVSVRCLVVTVTVPGPTADPATVTHAFVPPLDHVQPAAVSTATVWVPPAAVKTNDVLDKEKLQAWMTFTLWPAIDSVAVRLTPLFAVTATVAVPLPVPLPVTVAHDVGDVDDHVQPACVVTVTVAEFAGPARDSVVGDTA